MMNLVVRYTSQDFNWCMSCAIVHVDESLYNSNLTAQSVRLIVAHVHNNVFMLVAVPSYVCRNDAKRA